MEIVVGKKYQNTQTGSVGTVTAIGISSILIVFKGTREILWLKDDAERYLVPYVKSIEVGDTVRQKRGSADFLVLCVDQGLLWCRSKDSGLHYTFHKNDVSILD